VLLLAAETGGHLTHVDIPLLRDAGGTNDDGSGLTFAREETGQRSVDRLCLSEGRARCNCRSGAAAL
jgi:hypothetical protein